jgi:hypothetical protein
MAQMHGDIVGEVTETATEIDGIAEFSDRAERHVQKVEKLLLSLAGTALH